MDTLASPKSDAVNVAPANRSQGFDGSILASCYSAEGLCYRSCP